jgi:hypothetical protein
MPYSELSGNGISLMKHTVLIIIAILVVLNAPLLRGFFAEDDFDHLLAVQERTEFTGRPGWFNYTPVTALAWLHALEYAPDLSSSYLVLRLYSFSIQLVCGLLLFQLARFNGVPKTYALISAVLFLISPLTFEVRLRLSCLHYWVALAFMLGAFATVDQWVRNRQHRWLFFTYVLILLSLFSSVHGILVLPGILLYIVCIDKKTPPFSRRFVCMVCLPLALLAVFWFVVFLGLPMNPESYQKTTVGGRIVTSFNVILSGFSWHPYLWILFSEKIGNIKLLGRYPILFLTLCSLFLFFVGVFTIKAKHSSSWIRFCFAMLICSVLFPPKSYWMARYSLFSLPWVASLIALALNEFSNHTRLAHGIQRRFWRFLYICSALLVGVSAYNWHARYTRQHLAATSFPQVFYTQVRLHSPECITIKGVPQWIGIQYPWPACTSWINEFEELLTIIDQPVRCINIMYRVSDQSTNTFVATLGDQVAGKTLMMSWPTTMKFERINHATIKSRVSCRIESPSVGHQ